MIGKENSDIKIDNRYRYGKNILVQIAPGINMKDVDIGLKDFMEVAIMVKVKELP